MAAALAEGLGTASWWGLSPALDLRQHLPDTDGEAVVLLVGTADGRHLLRTAARARRGPPRTITLFIAEQRPETVARQLLFLLLATESCTGHRARAVALLELLGSSRLRSSTAELLTGATGRLRRWLTAGPGPVPVEVELMKSRERDAVEAVLRGWEHRGGPPRDPSRDREDPREEPPREEPPRDWERRLRRLHGARYDAREALADWDLRMGLHQRGATTVSPAEFGLWRESGVAFIPRTGGGHVPNPTLQSARLARADGQPGAELGYWGDVVAGPFLIFGLTSDDPRLLRTRNGVPEQTATEISVANVAELLREMHPGGPPRDEDEDGGPPGDEDEGGDPPGDEGEPPPREEGDDCAPPGDTDSSRAPLGPVVPSPVRVRFLPLGSARCPPRRAGLEKRCDLLVLGWRSLEELSPELLALAAPGATLLVELPTFVPTLRPPQLQAFRARAQALAQAGGFEPWGGPGEPPACARFRLPLPHTA